MAAEVQPREEHGLLGMLGHLSTGDPESTITLAQIVDEVEESGFGVMLFVVTLPAFIPIPVGGILSGPVVALLALQLMRGRHEPWLPKRMLDKATKRSALAHLKSRLAPLIHPLQRLVKPRADWMFEHGLAFRFTGLILFCLAILLALPIPATNYLFGVSLLLFSIAMIERDGWLMMVAWAVGLTLIGAAFVLSGQIIAAFGAMQDTALDLWQRYIV